MKQLAVGRMLLIGSSPARSCRQIQAPHVHGPEDLRPKGAEWELRLHEKNGKHHVMPCHHGHAPAKLSDQPMTQPDAGRMIRRRAIAFGIHAPIGNHGFRATGITAYLENGCALEHAREMAVHESPRTTKLYDRTKERLTQDEVERMRWRG
ncbi:MAG TPA: tyrosine-type recombinase/integrase [Methylocella sp.]|nr:tyrosine-type recombinase/integrase [Methylocella sp.]